MGCDTALARFHRSRQKGRARNRRPAVTRSGQQRSPSTRNRRLRPSSQRANLPGCSRSSKTLARSVRMIASHRRARRPPRLLRMGASGSGGRSGCGLGVDVRSSFASADFSAAIEATDRTFSIVTPFSAPHCVVAAASTVEGLAAAASTAAPRARLPRWLLPGSRLPRRLLPAWLPAWLVGLGSAGRLVGLGSRLGRRWLGWRPRLGRLGMGLGSRLGLDLALALLFIGRQQARSNAPGADLPGFRASPRWTQAGERTGRSDGLAGAR
jgi:hypothetical protein